MRYVRAPTFSTVGSSRHWSGIVKTKRMAKGAEYFEQLEQRWLLSSDPNLAATDLLAAPQTPLVVDATTITSLVAKALADAPAGDPIYMKYEGIDGDVTAKGFEGDIQLNSFQWGVGRGISAPTAGGAGREASAPSVSEIVVTKKFDSSSVPLIQEAFTGNGADVEIDFVTQAPKGDSQIYLKLDLADVLISGYSMSSGGDRPSESLSLNFTKISISSLTIKGETQKFTYDLVKQGGFALSASSAQLAAAAPGATGGDVGGSDPIFMKYGDIQGDVTAKGFEGDIQLNSFQWGVGRGISAPTAGGGRQVSAPSVSEITVTKQFDSSSVPLIREAFVGKGAPVETDFVNLNKDKAQTYLQVKLDNTLVSGYSMSSGGDRPSESLSLNFTKISISSINIKGETQNFKYDLAAQPKAALTPTTLALAQAASSPNATAAADGGDGGDPIYMKYGDIKGDVTAKGFEGAAQLNSFQWGVGRGISSPIGGAGREASAPSVSEITVTKQFDSSSVPLIQQAFGGDGALVETDFVDKVKGKLQPYLTVKLDNTLISGYSMSSGGDRPSETLSLNFTKISFSSIDKKGETQNFTFDLAAQPKATLAPATLAQAQAASSPNAAGGADGGDPIYMKYGDIQGDVTAKGFEGAVELNSFQWGVNRSISTPIIGGAGREASAPSVSEIVISKKLDSSSVPLMQQAVGDDPAHVEADFVNKVKGKLQPYLTVKLDNTLISGYSMSSGGDRPSESLSLNFTKISIGSVGIKGETQNFTFDLAKQKVTLAPVALSQVTSSPTVAVRSASTGGGGDAGDPIYMKYGDIQGDVTAKGFQGAAQLTSFQWGIGRGISSPVGGGGTREVSPPSVSEVLVTKSFDSSSVPLIKEAFIGGPTDVETDFVNQRKDGPQTYLKVKLDDTLISGYSMSSGGDRPSESLSLNFTKISISFINKKAESQNFTLDLTQQKAVLAPAELSAAATSSPALAAAPASTAGGGGDPIFMKYGDIQGDVTAKGFEGAAQLNSFRWGVGRGISAPTGPGAVREVSAPVVSEATITKFFDSSSVPLIHEAFVGDPAHVDFALPVNGGLQTYLSFDLENTLISGDSISSGGGLPSESLSLNFTKISISSTVGGQIQTFKYDLAPSKLPL
jgi:type VI secretion system secreted protein Hcp